MKAPLIFSSLFLTAMCLAVPTRSEPAADPYQAMGITRPDHAVQAGDFSLATLDGKHVRLADYRGKLVLLNFWATWCAPCRKEMPSIQRLWERFQAKDLAVLAVSEDDGERDQVLSFIRKIKVNFPILLDRDLQTGDSYMLPGLPTTYLIGRDGTIAATIVGTQDWSGHAAQSLIEYLLDQPH